MKKTVSAGGVVINSKGQIAIVSQKGLSWSFPKGHVDEGEETLAAARREIYEETGLKNLVLVKPLGSFERWRGGNEQSGELKTITMFLLTTEEEVLQPIDPDNPEAKWVEKNEVANVLTYEEDRQFFKSIIQKI